MYLTQGFCKENFFGRTQGATNMEILTVDELATMLKMTKRQVYTLTETRSRTSGSMKTHPLPAMKINGNLRFRRAAIEEWLLKVEANEQQM
jgi:predicted DNA-binding transcriptional regulator AlpA